MSNTRVLIVLTGLGLGFLLLYGISSQLPAPPETAASEAGENVPALRRKAPPVPAPPAQVVMKEVVREQKLVKQQRQQMLARLKERQELEQIARRTRSRWEELRSRNEWKTKQLIETNLSRFEGLKTLALREDDRELRCKICNGDAELDLCTICDSKGRCPSCDGVGRERFEPEKPCITCEGRTSCFFCAGRKKMKCPFCEQGRISTITPWPSSKLPLP